ncbi:MAG: D-alanyl-D-alanine carboxypeptidase family protein [Pseudomonadota bacterium]|nr:D-alanyl-D-alanine carboxypeptidase family protein [Pseudomonadota bacterium]
MLLFIKKNHCIPLILIVAYSAMIAQVKDLSYTAHIPKIASTSAILINSSSSTILAQKNAHEKLPPASLTKILSLYVIENLLKNGHIHLEDKVRISKKARYMEGSRMFLEQDSYETVDSLIDGLVVTSGNDATIALAEHVAGSEERFVEMMNQAAEEIGMQDSHFQNATGLPDEKHYSTAYDLGLLAHTFNVKHPSSMKRLSKKWLTYNGIKQHNRNSLLWQDPEVTGMKTGYTKEAGFCLITSANKKNSLMITVVLGDKTEHSRNQSTNTLLQFSQRAFDHITFKKDPDIQNSKVWYGSEKTTRAVLQKEVTISIPKKADSIEKKIEVAQNVFAPSSEKTIIGQYELYYDHKQLISIPLVLEKSLKPGSTFGTIRDYLQYQVENIIHVFFNL